MPTSCAENYTVIFGNSCYKFVTVKKNWHEAMKNCETDGANLVAMESASENTFLQTYIGLDTQLKNMKSGKQILLLECITYV